MNHSNREQKFKLLYPAEPKFRWQQLQQALFNPKFKDWDDITSISKEMRETLKTDIPWISLTMAKLQSNPAGDTAKAALKTFDEKLLETVLMSNSRGELTICLSSQIGCSIGCRFCATGAGGFTRDLDFDEIIDQYRFWDNYIAEADLFKNKRISNIVIMGMGEPFLNYDNVKLAMTAILKNTELGETNITVSTVGLLPLLNNLLKDKNWPNIRLAISLHAADFGTRKKLIPLTPVDFFPELIEWSKKYLEKFGNRRHHLSFEYVMIAGFNDSLDQAAKLAKIAKKIGQVKINLIPCNPTAANLNTSNSKQTLAFEKYLTDQGITATIRKSMGQDIDAACGQLAAKISKK